MVSKNACHEENRLFVFAWIWNENAYVLWQVKSTIGTETNSLLGKISEVNSSFEDLRQRLDQSVEQLNTMLKSSEADTKQQLEQLSKTQQGASDSTRQFEHELQNTRNELLASANRMKQCEQVS